MGTFRTISKEVSWSVQQNNKTMAIFFGVLLLILYTAYYFFSNGQVADFRIVQVLGFVAIVQMAYAIYSWYKVKGVLFDAYVIFTFALYAFNLAQPIVEALGISVSFRRLWGGFGISHDDYLHATYYGLAALMFFHIGALLSLTRTSQSTSSDVDIASGRRQLEALRKVATFFVFFSAYFYLRNLVEQIAIVNMYGYAAIYVMEYTTRTYSIIGAMFPPALLALFCSSLLLRKNEMLVTALVFTLLFLPPLYLGGRSNAMIVAAIFLIIYASIKKINLRRLVIIAALGIGLLAVMNVVGQTRNETGRSAESYRLAMDELENPVTSTLQEMGWSMYPLALSMEAIPAVKDYSYGASFFWAVVSCIPNLGFWDGTHPGMAHDPGTWLNKYSSENYGIGYSMTAGTWNEFGAFGVLLMFIYGWIFCRVFSNVSPHNAIYRPLQFVFAVLFLWYSIKFIRNSYDSFTRQLVFYMLPLYLLTRLILNNNLSKHQ